MNQNELELELIVAQETIREAEEAFDQLRKDYHALREHTDKLEAILKERTRYPISSVFGLVEENVVSIFNFYI